jgi:transcriptional regulator with XRE-family HTH domain
MATLGERLRQSRYQQGLDLDEISQKLKIRRSILEALEADEPGPVPAVYMRQFARRYGYFLGIPEHELQELLHQRFGAEGRRLPGHPVLPEARGGVRGEARLHVARALVYGGLVGALIAVVHYFFLRSRPDEAVREDVPPVVVRPVKEPPEGGRGKAADTLWRLRARARDTVWLSIVVDNQRSEQLLLQPGQEREWQVQHVALLSVGNAGGLQVWRNGEELPPLGPQGSVVRMVRVTATSVETSAKVPAAQRRSERGARAQNASSWQTQDNAPSLSPAPLLPVRTSRPEPQKPLPPP